MYLNTNTAYLGKETITQKKVRQIRELKPLIMTRKWGEKNSKLHHSEALEVILVLETHAELPLIKTRPDWMADVGPEGMGSRPPIGFPSN